MSIKRLFIFCILSLSALGLVFATALMWAAQHFHHTSSELANAINDVYAAEETEIGLLVFDRESLLHGLGKDPIHSARAAEAKGIIIAWLDQLASSHASATELALVHNVQLRVQSYLKRHDELAQVDSDPARIHMRVGNYLDDAYAALENLMSERLRRADALRGDAAFAEERAELAALMLTIVLAIGMIALTLVVRQRIYAPLVVIDRSIRTFGDGDFKQRVPELGPREIAAIASTFNHMAESLQRQRQTQLRFLSAVAHDLRNPLGAIKMSAELMMPEMGETVGDDERKTLLEVISRQTVMLERMVGDLLDTARIESGDLELRIAPHDLGGLCQDAVSLFRGSSARHQLSLVLPPGPLSCHCDPVRISQVLNNLLSNAIKYSPHGGSVRLSATVDKDRVCLSVNDEGIGIAREDAAHVFEPFRRTAATRDTIPGVGMGLSVSRRIVEAHGGTIEIDSELGRGSSILVSLPLEGQLDGRHA